MKRKQRIKLQMLMKITLMLFTIGLLVALSYAQATSSSVSVDSIRILEVEHDEQDNPISINAKLSNTGRYVGAWVSDLPLDTPARNYRFLAWDLTNDESTADYFQGGDGRLLYDWAFSPTEEYVALLWSNELQILSLINWETIYRHESQPTQEFLGVTKLIWSGDGSTLAFLVPQENLFSINLETQQELQYDATGNSLLNLSNSTGFSVIYYGLDGFYLCSINTTQECQEHPFSDRFTGQILAVMDGETLLIDYGIPLEIWQLQSDGRFAFVGEFTSGISPIELRTIQDNSYLLARGDDFQIWNFDNQTIVNEFTALNALWLPEEAPCCYLIGQRRVDSNSSPIDFELYVYDITNSEISTLLSQNELDEYNYGFPEYVRIEGFSNTGDLLLYNLGDDLLIISLAFPNSQ